MNERLTPRSSGFECVPAIRFEILGPLRVRTALADIDLGGPLQRKVLAVLLARRNEIVPRRELIGAIWSDDVAAFDIYELEDRKRGVLQTYIARLRASLNIVAGLGDRSGFIATIRPGYRLQLPDEHLDEAHFRSLLSAGRQARERGDLETALRDLGACLDLWRGHPFDEFRDEAILQESVTRLNTLRVDAVWSFIDVSLQLAEHQELIADARTHQWVREFPDNELLRAGVALALYRCGHVIPAADLCQEGISLIRTRWRVEPSPLVRLLRDIRARATWLDTVSPADMTRLRD